MTPPGRPFGGPLLAAAAAEFVGADAGGALGSAARAVGLAGAGPLGALGWEWVGLW